MINQLIPIASQDSKLQRDMLYPIGDRLSHAEGTKLDLPKVSGCFITSSVFAVYTGEKRCPKKGEWFLSGAIIKAYKAFNDMNTECPIAILVTVDRNVIYKIKSVLA
jgi:hypothetical protein